MVKRVELDMERQQVDVYVGSANGTRLACPECGLELAVYDHSGERTWRHLSAEVEWIAACAALNNLRQALA
jgi:transposase